MRRTGTVEQPSTRASGGEKPVTPEVAKPNLFTKAVYRLDALIRNRHGIFEYSNHPDCLFRMHIGNLDRNIRLLDGTCLAEGSRIAILHVWNEQIPQFPKKGPNLQWARSLSRKLSFSMRELARYLESRPDLADIEAVRAEMALGPPEQTPTIIQLSARYGFEPVAQPSVRRRGGALHRMGENILITMLVLARNPSAWGWDDLARDRAEVFISRSKLRALHGTSD